MLKVFFNRLININFLVFYCVASSGFRRPENAAAPCPVAAVKLPSRPPCFMMVLNISAILFFMKKKHQRTIAQIFRRPVSGGIKWADIESLFIELGAEIQEREGSRIAIILFGQVKVFHRPHPSPDTDKGAVASVRKWLEENGVKP